MENGRYYFERILLYAYYFLGLILSITILNAIFHYPTRYHFWWEPISRLGGINTTNQLANDSAAAIFASGMQLCAYICLFIAFAYIYWEKVISPVEYQQKGSHHPNRIMIILTVIMAAGAFLIGVPYDHGRWAFLHAFGVLLFLGGFCVLNIIAQCHKRTRKRGQRTETHSNITTFEIFLIASIFIAIVVYLVFFALDRIYDRQMEIFNLCNACSQKAVVILCLVAIFNLDNDDVLLPKFWGKPHPEKLPQTNKN